MLTINRKPHDRNTWVVRNDGTYICSFIALPGNDDLVDVLEAAWRATQAMFDDLNKEAKGWK